MNISGRIPGGNKGANLGVVGATTWVKLGLKLESSNQNKSGATSSGPTSKPSTSGQKESQNVTPKNAPPSITDWSNVKSKLDPTAFKGVEDPSKYLSFANSKQTLIDPVFAGRLAKYAKDHGIIISVTSNGGKRNYEDQVKAYKASGDRQYKNGNWYGGNGSAAVPGTGWHELGFAIAIMNR